MWIKSFRIQNFMSFEDSGRHELSRNMNIIVGQNNAGKTALLKGISMRLRNTPHRNSSFPTNHAYNPESAVDLEFVATGDELRARLLLTNDIHIPIDESWRRGRPTAHILEDFFLSRETITFRMRSGHGGNWQPLQMPSHQLYPTPQGTSFSMQLRPLPDKSGFLEPQIQAD